MPKRLHKALTLYCIIMIYILKTDTKTDISKFLKIVKFEALKTPKNVPK